MRKTQFETPEIGPAATRGEATRGGATRGGAVRACAHPGCTEDGLYPAPRSRDAVRDYIWFCLEHVREYNRNWNYFEGCGQEEMESAIRHSTTWERPTWKLGSGGKSGASRPIFNDAFDFGFGDFGQSGGQKQSETAKQPAPDSDESRAWEIFALSPCSDAEKVKKRYKELAKQHHPDANGGSRAAEDRLKSINWAYGILKSSCNALS